jgi:hypothetical protein
LTSLCDRRRFSSQVADFASSIPISKGCGVTRYEWAFSFPERDWWGNDLPGQQLAEVTAIAEHQVADDDQAPAIPQRLDSQTDRAARAWSFMRTPKTNCDIKSLGLACNRLHNAIRTAPMCRMRKGSGMAKLVFGMNQSLEVWSCVGPKNDGNGSLWWLTPTTWRSA